MAKKEKASSVIGWYSVKKAAAHSGLSLHMVNYLCRHGIITPSDSTMRGRGSVRKYTFADILLLRLIEKLLLNGISVTRLRKSLAALQKRGEIAKDILSKKYVATDGYNVYFKDDGVLEIFESGQISFAFVLELAKVRKEMLTKIKRDRKVASR